MQFAMKNFSIQIIFRTFQENTLFDFNGRMAKIDFSLLIILKLEYHNLQCPANNLTCLRTFLVFRRNRSNPHYVHTVSISYWKEGYYKCMCLSVCCIAEHEKRNEHQRTHMKREKTQLTSLQDNCIKLKILRICMIFVWISKYYIFSNLNLIVY